MREIKFRAWNESICEMVDLHKITPLALSDTMNTQLAIQNMDGLFIPFSSQFDLMQYTGLKDKNGKEIYEGDIVNHPRRVFIIDFGRYLDGHGLSHSGFFMKVINETDSNTRTGLDGSLEVIGNIHENPELLK